MVESYKPLICFPLALKRGENIASVPYFGAAAALMSAELCQRTPSDTVARGLALIVTHAH